MSCLWNMSLVSPCFRYFNFYAYSIHYCSETNSIIWIWNSIQVQILCHGIERRGLKSSFVLTKEFIKWWWTRIFSKPINKIKEILWPFWMRSFFSGDFKANKKNYSKININIIMQIQRFSFHITILLGLNKETYMTWAGSDLYC